MKHRKQTQCWTTVNEQQCLWVVSCLFTRGARSMESFAMCAQSVSYTCTVVFFVQWPCTVFRQSLCDHHDVRVQFAVPNQSVGRVRPSGSYCRQRRSSGERVCQTSAAWAFEEEYGENRALLDAKCGHGGIGVGFTSRSDKCTEVLNFGPRRSVCGHTLWCDLQEVSASCFAVFRAAMWRAHAAH